MNREKTHFQGVKESLRFLNFESGFHKIGFICLLCIVFLASVGAFSGGYLSEVTRKNTLKTTGLQYERFGRLQTEFKFKISAQKYDSVNKTLRIGGDFNKFYEMENIWPQPDSMYSKGNDLYLVYNDSEAMQNFTIWLRVTPVKPGSVKSFLQLNGEPEIRFRQFIYP
ncbi:MULTISPECIES: hypothetical protein [Gammaproteobacteria]|jgi:hypothetical protein|uniref:Uncharacterized protein n=22 Tax=Gammaproteobacteria TaxID=1236 RepID=R4J8V5_ECOLX|nr:MULTISPECIES: hypothetical protein [Gammaproteobacteria]EDI3226805.1 hypothetical protein [Salmonella enterica subsp. enterica serovar Newport]MBJ5599058.1 hypothetical protein [Salmonella enterica subsp. enterica serovar Thompson]MCL8921412.1 hypothetical protein [Salmonella enterica subsp. enterica serovar Enteritidis]MDE9652268.1 hypothetical protein [Citrobacter portucalensis]MDR7943190.1 hypothetical protein [Enterobacter soli]HAT3956368.1 hypothetical protein [Kluyvera ascorbata]HDS